MSEKPVNRHTRARDIYNGKDKPLPEPVYDLTTSDKTDLLKAAGP
jgi:hypothetical protein